MSTKLEIGILEALRRDVLWDLRRDRAINFMDEQHPHFGATTVVAFDQLASLVENEPQTVIDLIRAPLSTENLTPLLMVSGTHGKQLRQDIEFIAALWESPCLFALPAYLLSGRRLSLQNLDDPKAVYRYFRAFGITPRSRRNMRDIRTARSHKFTARDNRLIFYTDNKEEMEIDTNSITQLAANLADLWFWYYRFLLGHTFFIPKFGFLFAYTVIEKMKRDHASLEAYIEMLKTGLLPTSVFDLKKPRTLLGRVSMVYDRFRRLWLRNDWFTEFLSENQSVIIPRLKFHAKAVAEEIRRVSNELSNLNDKDNFRLIASYSELFGNNAEDFFYRLMKKP